MQHSWAKNIVDGQLVLRYMHLDAHAQNTIAERAIERLKAVNPDSQPYHIWAIASRLKPLGFELECHPCSAIEWARFGRTPTRYDSIGTRSETICSDIKQVLFFFIGSAVIQGPLLITLHIDYLSTY